MKVWRIAAALAVGVSVAACGGDGGGSKTPTAPTPRVSTITVTAPDLIYMGETTTASATVSKTDGSSAATSACSWGGDTPSVATINASGQVSALSPGQVTIWCDQEGVRGTKLIRVIPNFQGTWSGSYTVRTCSATGDWSGYCNELYPGRVLPHSANLTQDRDRVSGRMALGTIVGDGSGPVDMAGVLIFTATLRTTDFSVDTSWTLRSPRAGNITGAFSGIFRHPSFSGEARLVGDIRDMNRTLGLTMTPSSTTTLGGLLSAISHRR